MTPRRLRRQSRQTGTSVYVPSPRDAYQELCDCGAKARRKSSGYNTRLPPRFFAQIRDKLLPAHLRSALNRLPRTE